MRKYLVLSAIMLAAFIFIPGTAKAAEPGMDYAGEILIDTSRNGEAWYVNPQSLMRVYLGRPVEALERLRSRAIYVNFSNIARLAETEGGENDDEYAEAVSGFVLSPSDLLGAAWYVNPDTKHRMRLAVASDAWEVMSMGTPVSRSVLESIPAEPEGEPRITNGLAISDVESADTLKMVDGSKVRLIGVDTPSNPDLQEAAINRIKELVADYQVTLEADVKREAPDGTPMRFVHARAVNVSYDLVRNGLAFPAIQFPNFRYAEMMIVGSIDAQRNKLGFYDPVYWQNK